MGREIWGLYSRESRDMGILAHTWMRGTRWTKWKWKFYHTHRFSCWLLWRISVLDTVLRTKVLVRWFNKLRYCSLFLQSKINKQTSKSCHNRPPVLNTTLSIITIIILSYYDFMILTTAISWYNLPPVLSGPSAHVPWWRWHLREAILHL